jgi:hypothetical protein
MPYLHWATSGKYFDERSDLVEKLASAFKSPTYRRPSPSAIELSEPEMDGPSFSKTLKRRIMRAFLHPEKMDDPRSKDLYLHIRRTLDQFYYSTVRDADARTKDQVVYKFAMKQDKKEREYTVSDTEHDTEHDSEQSGSEIQDEKYKLNPSGKSDKPQDTGSSERNDQHNPQDHVPWDPPKVLMVNQLWLWVLNGHSGGESQSTARCSDGTNLPIRHGHYKFPSKVQVGPVNR